MRRLLQTRFIALPVALLLGLGVVASAAWADEPIPSEPLDNPASASTALKFLPKDYWLAAEVDCRVFQSFLGSPDMQRSPQYAQFKQALLLAKTFSGIDLEKEVDSVAVFLAGDPDKEPDYLLVVQGTFDNQIVESRLTQTLGKSYAEKTYKDTTIYASEEAALCFPVDKTILYGKESLIREAIDRLHGEKKALPAAVKNVLERTPSDHILWAAVRPKAFLASKGFGELGEQFKNLKENLAKLECVSLVFNMTEDGLTADALGYAADADGAKEVYDFLKARKSSLLTEEGANVFAASFLILSHLQNSGSYVQGSFQLTNKAIEELWNTKMIVKPKVPAFGSAPHKPSSDDDK